MLHKTLLATTALVVGVSTTACRPPTGPKPPNGTTTTSSSTTVFKPPPPKPCPTAPATAVDGPDNTSGNPISSWGVGGVTGGGAFTATVMGNVVYVGGLFTQAVAPNGTAVPRSNLAAFCLANGQLLEAFRADVTGGQVWALTNDGQNVFAAGEFTSLDGQPSNRLVKLDPLTGARVTSFNPPAVPGPIYALDYSSVTGDVYAGGSFRLAGVAGGGQMMGASFDHNTGAYDGWNPRADARIDSVAVSDDGQNVFIGGNFKNVGGQVHDNMARTAASNGNVSSIAFGANQGIPGTLGARVLSLDVDPDDVSPYAATGPVSPVGTATGGGNRAISMNGDGTENWRRGFNGDAQAILLIGNTVYVGFHDGFQNNTARRIVGLSRTTGNPTAFTPNANGHPLGVRGLAAGSTRLIAVGDFTLMGTTSQLHGLAIFP
jgi:hypothetical protein